MNHYLGDTQVERLSIDVTLMDNKHTNKSKNGPYRHRLSLLEIKFFFKHHQFLRVWHNFLGNPQFIRYAQRSHI